MGDSDDDEDKKTKKEEEEKEKKETTNKGDEQEVAQTEAEKYKIKVSDRQFLVLEHIKILCRTNFFLRHFSLSIILNVYLPNLHFILSSID